MAFMSHLPFGMVSATLAYCAREKLRRASNKMVSLEEFYTVLKLLEKTCVPILGFAFVARNGMLPLFSTKKTQYGR